MDCAASTSSRRARAAQVPKARPLEPHAVTEGRQPLARPPQRLGIDIQPEEPDAGARLLRRSAAACPPIPTVPSITQPSRRGRRRNATSSTRTGT